MSDFPRIIFDRYHLTDYDISSDPVYLGFLDKDGQWYIQEINKASAAIRFDRGDSGYAANWTGRTGLTYTYFDTVF